MNRTTFYTEIRDILFNGKLSQQQFQGIEEILNYCEKTHPTLPESYLAYILATVYHETGRTFNFGIREIGLGQGRKYGIKDPITKQIYYGRGPVQLTWKFNYEFQGKKLGVDLVNNPDLALVPANGVRILVEGCLDGDFTKKKLGFSNKNNPEGISFAKERQVINGNDCAEKIAGYARRFLKAIHVSSGETVEELKVDTKKVESPETLVTGKKPINSEIVLGDAAKSVTILAGLATQLESINIWIAGIIVVAVIAGFGYTYYLRSKKSFVEGV